MLCYVGDTKIIEISSRSKIWSNRGNPGNIFCNFANGVQRSHMSKVSQILAHVKYALCPCTHASHLCLAP